MPAPRRLELRKGYWCEVLTYAPITGRAHWLGSTPAATPRLALRWLRTRAQHIADQLDPQFAGPLRHWLTDQAAHEHALDLLRRGELFTHTVHEDELHYLLTARPANRTRIPGPLP